MCMPGVSAPLDRQAVFSWALLNRDALVEYWDGAIGTIEFARRLGSLPSP